MPHGYPRKRRVDELLRQEIARVVAEEVVDPELGFATVMRVESTPDLRHAKVLVSVLGSEDEKNAALGALDRASGFIRARVGDEVTLKYLPELHFEIDRSLERASRIDRILNDLKRESSGGPAVDPGTGGIVLVDKPVGPTSHDVVATLRRSISVRRVGHFGTLDPFATGLVVCAVGPATRLASFCSDHDKTYEVGVRLGWRSTTDDADGELTSVSGVTEPAFDDVENACRRWTGTVEQVPPQYSAKHVAGRRAYALARAGEEVDLPPVKVRIDRIRIERFVYPDLQLTVSCGGGVYMRALARDIGSELGTGAYCASLRRTRSGPFSVETALSWDAVADGDRVRAAMLSPSRAVASMPRVRLDAHGCDSVVNGQRVRHPGPHRAGWVRIDGPGGFVGIGEALVEDEAWWIQPRRILYPKGVP